MDFEDAKAALADALHSMEPTGAIGFEGLLRDVLVELTNLKFGLAKSGPQTGWDIKSTGVNLLEVALEAKRYGEKTSLPLDRLKAKLFEAVESGIDLWILAASREINATDQRALKSEGEKRGVTVLILDWPLNPGSLPDLAVLCTEAVNSLSGHLGTKANIGGIISGLKKHHNYSSVADRLVRRLVAPDIGYAAATEAMKKWTVDGFLSDRLAASRLGTQFNNILDDRRSFVRRPRYESQLNKWLLSEAAAVLLGDEGLGKTWLFLSWWYSRSSSDSEFPLTLFVPAQEIGPETLDQLLARLLAERLAHGNVHFWRRRINQWSRLMPAKPQIVLMIDGLNQYWQPRDWVGLLQPAYDDQWNGRISILMSCWPDHWNELQKLAPLNPQPIEIAIERFNDEELERLLDLHEIRRDRFDHAVLDLMKIPRLSSLAITWHKDLIASGDVTAERLAFEDWKHRIKRRGLVLALSNDEFKDFVADLGRELHSSINNTVLTRRSIIERLGRDSGKGREDLKATVAELIAGKWLVSTESTNHFRVNPELVPFALGLALAHQLRSISNDAQASAIIAEYLDPFKNQSLGVHILRSAVTVALLDNAVARPSQRALISRWINQQNFNRRDFEAFWRIIGLEAELFLEIIEETWLGEGASSFLIDEILIRGLANAYQYEAIAPIIERKICHWLGWFWGDPYQGFFLNHNDLTSEESQSRQQLTANNADAWGLLPNNKTIAVVQNCSSGNPSWLNSRAFGVISFLPRARLIKAFAAWGISRAVMGVPRHFDEMAWVLRVNRVDPVDARAAMDDLVDVLLAAGHPLACHAAVWLLEAIADRSAEQRLRLLTPEFESARRWSIPLTPSSHETILDPSVDVCVDELREVAGTFIGRADIEFESLRQPLVLARANPPRLREILGEMATSANGMMTADVRQRVVQLNRYYPILTDKELGSLLTAVDTVLGNDSEISNDLDWWLVRRFEILLAPLDGVPQLTLLMSDAFKQDVLTKLSVRLLAFSQDDLRSILNRFDINCPREALLRWLTFLVTVADDRAIDGWQHLPVLVDHTDPEIAELAIALSSRSNDLAVHVAIARGSWTADGQGKRERRVARSHALLKASLVLGRPELLDRANDQITAAWLEQVPDSEDAVRAYERYFRAALDRIDHEKPKNYQSIVRHDKAICVLLDRADDQFWLWLDRKLEKMRISHLNLIGGFPLGVIAEALMSRRADLGLRLWEKLMEAAREGVFRMSQIEFLPFLAADGVSSDARWRVIQDATNDQKLADLVQFADRSGRTDWIVSTALKLGESQNAEAVATSFMLLGFSDKNVAITNILSELGERVSNGGWLGGVLRLCRRAYERNIWARHWYSEFLTAKSDSHAIAAHMLLTATIDIRARNWIDRRNEISLSAARRKFWIMNTGSLDEAINRRRDKLKDSLFWTKTMNHTQYPWL